MTPVLVSVDKAGDLKIGRKKCRLYKKDEVVKVAKKYGISTEKKTVGELCGAIKARAKNSPQNTNNVPLAKLYPEAARKRAAAKKRAEKKALDRKVAANFMKTMTTRITTPIRERVVTPAHRVVVAVMPKPKPKPRRPDPAAVERARANVIAMANKLPNWMGNVERVKMKVAKAPAHKVMKMARELRRLR